MNITQQRSPAYIFFIFLFILAACNGRAQTTKTMQPDSSKTFSCDIETGICSPDSASGIEEISLNQPDKVRLVYYTDPICSACWAIEPYLRKLKLEYGQYVQVEYRMGGLLPGWQGFADKANGIAKPSDVAPHWDEVGQHSGMSIDGDVWLEDPLSSSFPPSIAYYAVRMQDEAKALKFLRIIREYVFLEKKNITKETYLVDAAIKAGADTALFLKAYRDRSAEKLFIQDMQERGMYGVRGFPTFIFVDKEGKGLKISGMSPYAQYVEALERAYGQKLTPAKVTYTPLQLLSKYGKLSTREIAAACNLSDAEAEQQLNSLAANRQVTKIKEKHGNFWLIAG